jgi:hypothetical protein
MFGRLSFLLPLSLLALVLNIFGIWVRVINRPGARSPASPASRIEKTKANFFRRADPENRI